jgi:hypothetical protein
MKLIKKVIICIALAFSILFVGVGYASLSTDFEIKGLLSAEIPNKVFITAVTEHEANNASVASKTFSSTVLNTSTYMTGTSSIVYEVTFFNGSDLIYEYVTEEIHTHSNQNVSYLVTDLLSGQQVKPKTYITAYLRLNSNVTTTENLILNFKFVVANLDVNIGVNNHVSLIDAMVNDPTNGLNTSDSYLNEQIKKRFKKGFLNPSRDTLGSMAITQGNTLEEMFGDSYATNEKISYVLKFYGNVNTQTIDYYDLFTTSVILGPEENENFAIDEYIYPIYKTRIIYDTKEGCWVAGEIVEGYAQSQYYDESQLDILIHTSEIPSFDEDTWKEGKLGTSMSNAALITINQNSYVTVDAANYIEKRYFKVIVPANTNKTFVSTSVNSNSQDISIELYNTSGSLLSTATNSLKIPTSSSQQTYIIAINGSRTMNFKFQ